MLKMLIAGILGGFVLGIFTVAVLGWINDAREDKEEKKRIEEVAKELENVSKR